MKQKTPLMIEFAKPGDEGGIAKLIAALAKYEKAPKANLSTEATVREQLFGPNPAAEVLMARSGDQVVGFALFFPTFSTWLCRPGMYLEDLFVMPAFRKQGVAKALLQRLAEICGERQYGRLEWSCLEWNELAKGFYRRLGAAPMEEWRTWRMEGDAIGQLAAGVKEAAPEPKALPAPEPEPDTTPKAKVVVYTDGGCQPNPGVGGWAAILIADGKRKELVGGEDVTTNNRMEMLAAISALEALKRPCEVTLVTDSEYLKNGITSWIHGWKKKGWRKKDGKPVLNDDLWRRLDTAIQRHTIKWAWVKGHAGVQDNERCDVLCGEEIARRRKVLKGE